MKTLIIGYIFAMTIAALLTGFVMVHPLIGAIVMLSLSITFLMLFLVIARGPAMQFMKARLHGGMILTVVKRDRQAKFGRIMPHAGMARTRDHGAFTMMPGKIYSAGGTPWAVAPENVGYNVGIDHAQLVDELKKRGINNVTEIADVDAYGRVLNFKDDERIKDLKKKYDVKPEMTSFDDFYRYTTEAANPIHQEANISLGINQGLLGQAVQKYGFIIAAGIGMMFACVGVYMLLQQSGGGTETIEIIIDNAKHVINV